MCRCGVVAATNSHRCRGDVSSELARRALALASSDRSRSAEERLHVPARSQPYADDWRGHTGGIYRASNWTYLGKTKDHPTYVINGVMTARKAGPRTRTHSEMLALGAVCEGSHAKHKFVLIRGEASRHNS